MKIETIVVVDDNETDQFLNEMIIEKFDSTVQVIKAYDGQEALDKLASLETPPNIILLNINMPGLNGFQFLEKFDPINDLSTVVAMLSSSEQADDRKKALSYDCVKDYLLKPLDVDKLKALARTGF